MAAWGGELGAAQEAALAGLAPEAALRALPQDGAEEKGRRLLVALNEGLLARLRYSVQTAAPEELDAAVQRAYEVELSGLAWARNEIRGSPGLATVDEAAPSLQDLEDAARRRAS